MEDFFNPWKAIRENIIRTDNNTCQCCYQKNDKLEVHHIIPKYLDGHKYNIKNLITLCKSCHKHIHREFNKINFKSLYIHYSMHQIINILLLRDLCLNNIGNPRKVFMNKRYSVSG